MARPMDFNSVAEAVDYAKYIGTLLDAEHRWINNRVSWLFISQSFCIMAYVTLTTSTVVRFEGSHAIEVLNLGLPVFGVVCCVVVGVAVFAATRVASSLSRERKRLVMYINENGPATIPMIGAGGELRMKKWLYWWGEMPHRLLPWVLGALWLSLLIW